MRMNTFGFLTEAMYNTLIERYPNLIKGEYTIENSTGVLFENGMVMMGNNIMDENLRPEETDTFYLMAIKHLNRIEQSGN